MTAGGIEVNFSFHRAEHANGDENSSAYLNSQTAAMFCHGCGFKGTAPDLVADVQQTSRQSAEQFLREIYGVAFNEPVGGSMAVETDLRFREAQPEPPRIPPPESWLSSVRVDWDRAYASPESHERYMLERGLMPSTLAEWGIGYDFLSDRLTIPVHDVDGVLFGVKGRDWTGRHGAKYMILGNRLNGRLDYGFDTYEITSVVFGLHRARQHRSCLLLEGELDALAMSQMGHPRPVASGRAGLSSMQVKLLVQECEEVVVYYDCGPAGEKATDQAVELLEPYALVRVVEPLDVDPCDALKYGREDEVLRAVGEAESSLHVRPYSGRIKQRA
jgi:DNA primase